MYEAEINGTPYWVIDARRYKNGKRVGKLEYFSKRKFTKKQVDGRVDVLKGDIEDHGHDHGSLTPAVRTDAVRAEEILKPFGKTILDAAKFYAEHLQRHSKGTLPVEDATKAWLELKQTLTDEGKYSNESMKSARYRIGILEEKFKGQPMHAITASSYEDWLTTAGYSPRSMAGLKSVHSEFFKWCMRPGREWIQTNPCLFMRVKHIDKEVEILTPEQAGKLLECAEASPFKAQAVPYLLVSLFAGLRPSEAERLAWEDINFQTKEIRVASRKGFKSTRYVPMNDDLVARLSEHKSKGQIIGVNWEKNFKAIKRFAGFNESNPFPTDCLRHSFASYWLAIHNDRARLAEIMDNSVDVIREHYRKAVPKGTAEAFWKLIAAQVPA